MVSIGDFLDAFGFENLLLIATFLISFALINFILKRFLKDKYEQPNKAVAGIVAFAISMLIVYGVHRMEFDLENFFYNIGIGSEILEMAVPLIVLAAVMLLIWKIGICLVLFALGLLLTIISFTDLVYEPEILLITGIVLVIAGIICFWVKKRKPRAEAGEYFPSTRPSPVEISQEQLEKLRRQEWEEIKRKQEEQERRLKKAEAEAKKKKRAVYDLKQKYLAYLYEYSRFVKKGQEEAAKRKRTRIKGILNTIIAYAERAGVPKERFLSKEIARTKAKAPEELKEP